MKRDLYDIDAENKRGEIALQEMKKRERPGQATGLGTKMDVLLSIKDAILAATAEGYTPRQIANALKSDTFSILPKSVTTLLNQAKGAAVPKPRKTAAKTETKSSTKKTATKSSARPTTPSAANAAANDGSFVPKKDRT